MPKYRVLGAGIQAEAIQLDVTQQGQIASALKTIENRFGHLDILINNGAVSLDDDNSVFDMPIETFQSTLDINLIGPLRLTQKLIPLLKGSPNGRIVNVSSGMGALTDMGGGDAAYRLSKTGLNALTRIMAHELRGTRVKVNAVFPGWVRTDPTAARGCRRAGSRSSWAAAAWT